MAARANHRPQSARDWLAATVRRFDQAGLHFGHGSSNARDEAAYLLLHTLKLPLDDLDGVLDQRLTPAEIEALEAIIQRRIEERIPAAYLTREAWLGEFRFYVDERVIIPRSYIAELVPGAIEPFVGPAANVKSALDMCTGSGCLAILMAHAYPEADIDAVDISSDALAVAQRNVSDYGLAARINLIRSDLFANLPEKNYDLVICNPPYVDAMAMETLPTEYRHEPRIALEGGDDGLDAVRVLLKDAPRFLNHGASLVVEVGQNRAAAENAFPRLPMVWLPTATSEDSVFVVKREDLVSGRST